MKIIKLIFGAITKNQTMIYVIMAVAIGAFAFGGYSGWKIQKMIQTSANMKVIENDIDKREEQDEVDSISYDSDSFRNGILRRGRL